MFVEVVRMETGGRGGMRPRRSPVLAESADSPVMRGQMKAVSAQDRLFSHGQRDELSLWPHLSLLTTSASISLTNGRVGPQRRWMLLVQGKLSSAVALSASVPPTTTLLCSFTFPGLKCHLKAFLVFSFQPCQHV